MDSVELGKLTFVPVGDAVGLVGDPVRQYIEQADADGLWVSEIEPHLADTAAFCEQYDIGFDMSANCVVVEANGPSAVARGMCGAGDHPCRRQRHCAQTFDGARFRLLRWTPRFR